MGVPPQVTSRQSATLPSSWNLEACSSSTLLGTAPRRPKGRLRLQIEWWRPHPCTPTCELHFGAAHWGEVSPWVAPDARAAQPAQASPAAEPARCSGQKIRLALASRGEPETPTTPPCHLVINHDHGKPTAEGRSRNHQKICVHCRRNINHMYTYGVRTVIPPIHPPTPRYGANPAQDRTGCTSPPPRHASQPLGHARAHPTPWVCPQLPRT